MNTFDRIIIIFNPQSTGDGPKLAAELAQQLKAENVAPIELIETEYAGHAIKIAETNAKTGHPLIVSVSGDGGYNEVINGVMHAENPNATAAVLAAGNANDHARVMQDKPLFELIKDGKKRHIDLLQMTVVAADDSHQSRYAHSYIGFGLTPTVALELEKGAKGSISEITTTLKTFGQAVPFELVYPNDVKVEIDSLIFANISEMAKVATLSDEGAVNDGLFEVITIPHVSKARAAYYAVKAAVLSLGEQPSVRSFEFQTLKAMPAQLDGELWELKKPARIVIRCQKKALQTLA
jgi:diacylglycerol kinase (ATP)